MQACRECGSEVSGRGAIHCNECHRRISEKAGWGPWLSWVYAQPDAAIFSWVLGFMLSFLVAIYASGPWEYLCFPALFLPQYLLFSVWMDQEKIVFQSERESFQLSNSCPDCYSSFLKGHGQYCNNCLREIEGKAIKQKSDLFSRPQPQVWERKISNKEKQNAYAGARREGYTVFCTQKWPYDACPGNVFLGNDDNPLDFYRVVGAELTVELMCRRCAQKRKLLDGESAERSRRISQRVKDEVWRRDGGQCVQCESRKNIEYDHIIPFSKGGSNTARNVQILCESCNRKKSDNIG